MMMHMSYWFGTNVADLVFKGFTISSPSGLVMTCFGLTSVAILFEAIKVYQAHRKQIVILEEEHCHSARCANESSSLLGDDKKNHIMYSHRMFMLLQETAWYVLQTALAYGLMLCIMTYNAYFTIAVSVGAGIGYLVFGPVLLEIGLKNGGVHRPKRVCSTCLGTMKIEADVNSDDRTISNIAEGMIHCTALSTPQEQPSVNQSENSGEGHCKESIVVVHRSD